jgi:hypothetical protein
MLHLQAPSLATAAAQQAAEAAAEEAAAAAKEADPAAWKVYQVYACIEQRNC